MLLQICRPVAFRLHCDLPGKPIEMAQLMTSRQRILRPLFLWARPIPIRHDPETNCCHERCAAKHPPSTTSRYM
jgi:hypothetical protein